MSKEDLSQDRTEKINGSRIVSIVISEFTVGLHYRTPLHELLCTSLSNTFHVASTLYQEARKSFSEHVSENNNEGGTKETSLSTEVCSIPRWLKISLTYRHSRSQIMRLSTPSIVNMFSPERKDILEYYLKFISKFNDSVSTNEIPIRYPFLELSSP